jgi:hypothetical protein
VAKHCKPSECEVGKYYRVVASSNTDAGKPGDIMEIMSVSSESCQGMTDDWILRIFMDKWDAVDSSGNHHLGEILEGPYDSREGVLLSATLPPGNECPDCGCAMEWIGLAMKCPRCWNVV